MIEHIFMRELSAGSKEAEQRLNAMVAEHGWEVVSWIPTDPPVPGRFSGGRWLLRREVPVPGSAPEPVWLTPDDPSPLLLVKTEDSMLGWLKPPNIFERWLMRRGWLE